MTEKEQNVEPAAEKNEAPKAESSGMMKYIVIGGGAFLLVIAIAVTAMLLMGGNGQESADAEATHDVQTDNPDEQATAASHGSVAGEVEDSLVGYEGDELSDVPDPSVIDNIMDNLAFLDYQPEEGEVLSEDERARMSVEDSVAKADWLKTEKSALAAKEKDLAEREQKLALLDKKVSQKLLTLEQAETARISNLAKLYDGMDPRSVAQLMANLDDETVVALIPRMKTKNASSVLALLPPKRAAKLSKQMITIAEN